MHLSVAAYMQCILIVDKQDIQLPKQDKMGHLEAAAF